MFNLKASVLKAFILKASILGFFLGMLLQLKIGVCLTGLSRDFGDLWQFVAIYIGAFNIEAFNIKAFRLNTFNIAFIVYNYKLY